jgi:hypothetical protein
MAEILPFPTYRRREYVRRQACRMAELSPKAAEKHLAAQLALQVRTMARKGIAEAIIERELRTLETAIRVHLWQLVLTGDTA